MRHQTEIDTRKTTERIYCEISTAFISILVFILTSLSLSRFDGEKIMGGRGLISSMIDDTLHYRWQKKGSKGWSNLDGISCYCFLAS
jgi:hypothetical protein